MENRSRDRLLAARVSTRLLNPSTFIVMLFVGEVVCLCQEFVYLVFVGLYVLMLLRHLLLLFNYLLFVLVVGLKLLSKLGRWLLLLFLFLGW